MPVLVMKFGGTSVASLDKIKSAAERVASEVSAGHSVIVIVSAMAGKTNELYDLSKKVSQNFNKRELDVLLSSGEQVSCALLAGALKDLGILAKSWLNWQIPIFTEGDHTNSRIINMNVNKINDYLKI